MEEGEKNIYFPYCDEKMFFFCKNICADLVVVSNTIFMWL